MKRVLVLLSGLAFISLGLPDGLLGVAWPSIRQTFGRELDALGVLLVAATAGYVSASFASGPLLRHLNLGAVLALSCAATALALFGYAAAGAWTVLVSLAVLLGLGGGAIDSALNTYVATNHGHRTMNWLHACYGIGAALGPLIMTTVLSSGGPWQRGYTIVAAVQMMLAAAFVFTLAAWPRAAAADPTGPGAATIRETLGVPAARLAIATFFVYTGAEASFGAWTYTLLTAARGMSPVEAGAIVSIFWGSLTGGRLLAAFVGGRLTPGRLLNLSFAGVVAGALLLWVDRGDTTSMAGVLLAGCACGPIFPTLVAVTPARLGSAHAANGVGFQIAAAAVGLSVVPGLVGVIAVAAGVETIATLLVALSILLVCVHWLLDTSAPLPAIPHPTM